MQSHEKLYIYLPNQKHQVLQLQVVKECLEEDEEEKVVGGPDETDQMMERK